MKNDNYFTRRNIDPSTNPTRISDNEKKYLLILLGLAILGLLNSLI